MVYKLVRNPIFITLQTHSKLDILSETFNTEGKF